MRIADPFAPVAQSTYPSFVRTYELRLVVLLPPCGGVWRRVERVAACVWIGGMGLEFEHLPIVGGNVGEESERFANCLLIGGVIAAVLLLEGLELR